jgi:A/G-specific adenine glycosylase
MDKPPPDLIAVLRHQLLAWYDVHARQLPWRVPPAQGQVGRRPDPYHVWLSEIMLQQTGVVTVKPYFAAFLARYPKLEDLAVAPLDDVLGLWAGLGYYARARNLHAGAKAAAALGGFPASLTGLLAIKGIGPYTAAAVAAIAFDLPHVPVDGNVERVLSRLWLIEAALPAAKPIFRDAASKFEDPHRPGDFAQAMMDLGATVCTPRNPACGLCPWSGSCAAYANGSAADYPKKQAKKAKPVRFGVAFVYLDPNGVLVRRRPNEGLLGGMLEVPNLAWRDTPYEKSEIVTSEIDPEATWIEGESVRHIFTHFELRMRVFTIQTANPQSLDGYHHLVLAALATAALPSLMQKIIASAQRALDLASNP